MPHYVALLRGINVGGHRVTMQRLCALFAERGLTNVSSFIASGNVRFDTDRTDTAALEQELAAQLEAGLGYAVPVFLRTLEELRAVLAFAPFDAAELANEAYTVHVGFLHAPLPAANAAALPDLATAFDGFNSNGRVWYWLCRGRSSDTLVKTPALNRALGAPTTLRNLVMLRKLVHVMGG